MKTSMNYSHIPSKIDIEDSVTSGSEDFSEKYWVPKKLISDRLKLLASLKTTGKTTP